MRLLLTLTALVCCVSSLHPCTGLKLTAKNGSTVHGRTLEFGVVVDASVAVFPRGMEFTGTAPKGPGLKYQSKYGAVGMIAYGNPTLMDGMNEKGLSIGTFYFPGFAGYASITADNQAKALSPIEFPHWILMTCASIEDVKAALSNVVIAPTVNKAWGNQPAPFHYIVYDKKGQALVIEPIDGQLKTYDNPIGAFSNSPNFEWHMTNLRNYINLTPWNVKPVSLNGLTFAPFGQGSGMVGLPGDFTPPSRFVRAAIFSLTATPSETSDDAVYQAFHILNQFDIPVGTVRQKEGDLMATDSTQVTCVHDPESLKYYFRTYDDQTIRVVDLKKFDFSSKAVKQVSAKGTEKSVNITDLLK